MSNLSRNHIKFVLAIMVVVLIAFIVTGLFFVEMPKENANLINMVLSFVAGWVGRVYSSYFSVKNAKQSEDNSDDESN